MVIRLFLSLAIMAVMLPSASADAAFGISEYSGKVTAEQRYFVDDGQYQGQSSHNQQSFSISPELYWQWNDGDNSVSFVPFYRYDMEDSERTHFDIRELYFLHVGDDWELKAGIRKEYWGVTEFQHLVDVLNQTDNVDSFDGEQKLGQQMVNLSLVKDWGIVDIHLMPGFRERTFAGNNGRLRGPLVVDKDNVEYESSAGNNHIDVAARWSQSIGDFDVGAYWFHGTNRDPGLAPTTDNRVLRQYYEQMDQLGLDIQATKGDVLWKLESIYRKTSGQEFWAAQAGFEYTHVGVFDSAADIGLLMEYAWDARGDGKGNDGASYAAMQNDLFLGGRLTLNDVQSSELLVGIGTDLHHSASMFIVEASRRLGESFKASLEARVFQSSDNLEPLYYLNNDDHVAMTLEWYF